MYYIILLYIMISFLCAAQIRFLNFKNYKKSYILSLDVQFSNDLIIISNHEMAYYTFCMWTFSYNYTYDYEIFLYIKHKPQPEHIYVLLKNYNNVHFTYQLL